MDRRSSPPTTIAEPVELFAAEAAVGVRNSGREAIESGADAVETLRRQILEDPGNVRLHVELGALLTDRNRHEEAIGCYLTANRLCPDSHEICNRLGRAFADRGLHQPAIDWFQIARRLNPCDTSNLYRLGASLLVTGCVKQAAEIFDLWVKAEPENPIARHMSVATMGGNEPSKASPDYVQALFDGFAPRFDKTLAKLQYRGPEVIAAVVGSLPGRPAVGWSVLEVGCGTGLVGAVLRPMARHLVGVDLSVEMLAMAKARNIYDELIASDMFAYLQSQVESFEVLTAADVLPYLGELNEFFQFAAQTLTPKGIVVTTVEALEGKADYWLSPTGRFCHSREHLHHAMVRAGFTVHEIRNEVIRNEGYRPVASLIAVGLKA
jgi:predicted TPR repeat methyltransferase